MGLEERLRAATRDFKQAEAARKKVDDAAKKDERQKPDPQNSDGIGALKIPETLAMVEKAARRIFGNPPGIAHFWNKPQTEFRSPVYTDYIYQAYSLSNRYPDMLIASARAGRQWAVIASDISGDAARFVPKWRLDVIAYTDSRGIKQVAVDGNIDSATTTSGGITGEIRPASEWTKVDIEEEILSAFRRKLSISR